MLRYGELLLELLSLNTNWSLSRSVLQLAVVGAISPDIVLGLSGDARTLSAVSAPSYGSSIRSWSRMSFDA